MANVIRPHKAQKSLKDGREALADDGGVDVLCIAREGAKVLGLLLVPLKEGAGLLDGLVSLLKKKPVCADGGARLDDVLGSLERVDANGREGDVAGLLRLLGLLEMVFWNSSMLVAVAAPFCCLAPTRAALDSQGAAIRHFLLFKGSG